MGDMVNVGRGYEAGVTASARCRWVWFMECGELLYRKKCGIKVTGLCTICI